MRCRRAGPPTGRPGLSIRRPTDDRRTFPRVPGTCQSGADPRGDTPLLVHDTVHARVPLLRCRRACRLAPSIVSTSLVGGHHAQALSSARQDGFPGCLQATRTLGDIHVWICGTNSSASATANASAVAPLDHAQRHGSPVLRQRVHAGPEGVLNEGVVEPQRHCWDNAPTERLWGSLKVGRLHSMKFATRRTAMDEIVDCWVTFKNYRRLHSTLGSRVRQIFA